MDSKHMMSYVSIPIDEPIEQNANEENEEDEEDEESITSRNANLTINDDYLDDMRGYLSIPMLDYRPYPMLDYRPYRFRREDSIEKGW